jgi:hypothetical protein
MQEYSGCTLKRCIQWDVDQSCKLQVGDGSGQLSRMQNECVIRSAHCSVCILNMVTCTDFYRMTKRYVSHLVCPVKLSLKPEWIEL